MQNLETQSLKIDVDLNEIAILNCTKVSDRDAPASLFVFHAQTTGQGPVTVLGGEGDAGRVFTPFNMDLKHYVLINTLPEELQVQIRAHLKATVK